MNNNEMVFGSMEYWQSLINVAKADSVPEKIVNEARLMNYKPQAIKPTDAHGVDADGFACYTVHFDF